MRFGYCAEQQSPVKKRRKRLRTLKERNRLRPERLRSETQPTGLQGNNTVRALFTHALTCCWVLEVTAFTEQSLQESGSHHDDTGVFQQKTRRRAGENSQV